MSRWFEAELAPELGAYGEVQSVLGVARDITAPRHREAARAELYHELLDRTHTGDAYSSRTGASGGGAQFTALGLQILCGLARGLTNRQIGAELNLSAGTIKNHLAHLLPRLDAVDRTQAAVSAARLGLVQV